MPSHTDSDANRLKQIIIDQRENYGQIAGTFMPNDLIERNPDKVASILSLIDSLIDNKAAFVIVADIKKSLPAFEGRFRHEAFYVLTVDAPEVSYAFSEMINNLMKQSQTGESHSEKFMKKLREGAQHKAVDFNTQLQTEIKSIQSKGFHKTQDIIKELNDQGFKTRRGEDWGVHNFYRAQKQIGKISSVEGDISPK